MTAILRRIKWHPAMLGFLAAGVLWAVIMAYSGGSGGGEIMTAALSFAIFVVIAGTGQMFVIASGPGNIDLSSPAVITLAAYLSMNMMAGVDAYLPLGLVVALAVGIGVGSVNFGLIRALHIPPIIATLAASFAVMSLAMNAGGESTIKPPAALESFMLWRPAGVQVALIAAIAGSIIAQIVISKTIFGRRLLAAGQNERAAKLTGIRVAGIRLTAYMISGALSGLTGFLLAGFTGGAALNMGDSYLMESVAVAVLGGASVAGGRANALGIWGAALFLSLLTTMLNASGVDVAWRFILSGAIIIIVILLAVERR